jgi:membrane-associated phospholipid phosphatase
VIRESHAALFPSQGQFVPPTRSLEQNRSPSKREKTSAQELLTGEWSVYLVILGSPSSVDVWIMGKIAGLLGRHPFIDLEIQSGVVYNLLGGYCFAAAVFVCWVFGARPGEEKYQRHLLTTLLGCIFATLLTFLVGAVMGWSPPNQNPLLAHLYPDYILRNSNASSFPSQSTAVCAAIAAGIYALHKRSGAWLWFAVVALVSLPRIYLGGHYPSDVLAGLACGEAGYLLARSAEKSLTHVWPVLQKSWSGLGVTILIFMWVHEIATGFRGVKWFQQAVSFSSLLTSRGNSLCIGGDTVWHDHFRGRVDEVRVYSRALSQAEIRKDMNTPIRATASAPAAASRASDPLGANEVSREGLVAAYSFDEAAGETVSDDSGNAHRGAIHYATWTSEGRFGSALNFDGKRSVVTIDDSPTLHLNGSLTLEAWVYPTDVSARWTNVVHKETDVYWLDATNPDRNLAAAGGSFTANPVFAPSALPIYQWSHLATTFDGSKVRLYVDGEEVASGEK